MSFIMTWIGEQKALPQQLRWTAFCFGMMACACLGTGYESVCSGTMACEVTSMLQIAKPIAHSSSKSDGGDLVEASNKSKAALSVESTVRHSDAHLALRMARAAEDADDSVTRKLFQSFRICTPCQTFKRFGEPNDGGYLMCMDGLNNKTVTAALSFGVEKHDQWSEDITQEFGGIPVSQFDCTVSEGSSCPQCKFFPKCVRARDGSHDSFPGRSWTLAEALKNSGQGDAADRSLIMKMDIEASEWPIMAVEDEALLRKFRQIVIEFHWLQNQEEHPRYLTAMRRILDAGFSVAHVHGNNYADMYSSGEDRIPQVVEVTFVAKRQHHKDGQCAIDAQNLDLDAPNNPRTFELPPAHLAF